MLGVCLFCVLRFSFHFSLPFFSFSVEQIDGEEKELKKKLDLDEDRKDRNREEMAQEAEEYRKLFL